MNDNRMTELLKDYAFALRRLEYDADKPGSNMTLGEYEAEEKKVIDEYSQAIAATFGKSNETAKVLIDDMLDFIGNCCETTLDCDCCDPVDCKYLSGDGELAECTRYQDFLSRAKAIAATLGSEFNPDGLPVGLTISDDSNLLNWRGENYVRQSALDDICANLAIIANGEPNVIADIAIETIEALIDECNTANRQCNKYRSKFGKCLDYADAIHALMDEGIA